MKKTGHYICDICHKFIRVKRKGKITRQKVVNHKPRILRLKNGVERVYYTKAHKTCIDQITCLGDLFK